jgi:hypothetical protein
MDLRWRNCVGWNLMSELHLRDLAGGKRPTVQYCMYVCTVDAAWAMAREDRVTCDHPQSRSAWRDGPLISQSSTSATDWVDPLPSAGWRFAFAAALRCVPGCDQLSSLVLCLVSLWQSKLEPFDISPRLSASSSRSTPTSLEDAHRMPHPSLTTDYQPTP